MPVEECGNMIFMALAYSQFTDNPSYLEKHYRILKQWTKYLIDFGLIPATQGANFLQSCLRIVSTDDFAGPLANQSNLALKAILGIRAMSEIASITDNDNDARDFMKTSHEYMQRWEQFSFDVNSTHAKLAYQLNNSWGLQSGVLSHKKALYTTRTQMIYWTSVYSPTMSATSKMPGITKRRVPSSIS